VSWVDAERVWIDGMAQMMVAAAVLAAVWSARNGSAWRHAIAGSVLGLAGLTKLPAGLVAPAVLVVWLLAPRRPRQVEIVAYLLPPTLLVGAWLSISKISLGAFIPVQWPTEWIIQEYPWIKHTLERSPLTYVSVLLLVSPALAFALVGAARVRRSPWLLVPLAWAVAFWLGLTALGAAGMGFQLRFIAPGIPALCLLAAAGVQSLSRPWRIAVVPLCVYSLLVGSQSALVPGNVDPRPQPLWGAVLELFGRDPSGIPEF
jgi:hypothetical protein